MGYDMYLVYNEDGTDEGYFRRNIWGMSTTRAFMEAFEMGYWFDERVPYPEHNLTQAERDLGQELLDEIIAGDTIDRDTVPEHVLAYVNAVYKWLVEGNADAGIAMHKLSSNDGWVVTPEECLAAVAAYERAPDDLKTRVFRESADGDNSESELREWFEKWVAYLRRGAASKGFRVW